MILSLNPMSGPYRNHPWHQEKGTLGVPSRSRTAGNLKDGWFHPGDSLRPGKRRSNEHTLWLFNIAPSKKCTPLWFPSQMLKTPGIRTTFGGSDVASLRFTTLHYMILHYMILHYTTLHYTTLQDITLHYTPVHYITLHYTPVYSTTLNYTTPHYTTLHSTPLHYITLHYTTFHYTPLH